LGLFDALVIENTADAFGITQCFHPLGIVSSFNLLFVIFVKELSLLVGFRAHPRYPLDGLRYIRDDIN